VRRLVGENSVGIDGLGVGIDGGFNYLQQLRKSYLYILNILLFNKHTNLNNKNKQ